MDFDGPDQQVRIAGTLMVDFVVGHDLVFGLPPPFAVASGTWARIMLDGFGVRKAKAVAPFGAKSNDRRFGPGWSLPTTLHWLCEQPSFHGG
jgi:hypothetical protein